MPTTTKFKIHINRRLFEATQSPMTGLEILQLGGYDATHDLFLVDGEGGSPAGTPIGHDVAVDLKNGLHFRAIPRDANFG